MKFVVHADDASFNELSQSREHEWLRVDDISSFADVTLNADAFFNLYPDAHTYSYSSISAPVFISSVTEIAGSNKNITRINGWSGFLEHDTWEMAGAFNKDVELVLNSLGKKYIVTADVPGFISAGIIAMIINEAFYALQENVSTALEIDVAMKLGTNYPYGPFEWAEKIGLKNIYGLLLALSSTNKKYLPAALMTDSIENSCAPF